jgi:putative endonuclease
MPMQLQAKKAGIVGEHLVAQFLKRRGFTILAFNYTKRTGEVDLIAQCHNLIAFVEVKTRTKLMFDLTEVINKTKQRRIISAAKIFIHEYSLYEHVLRFDIALIKHLDEGTITYIPNAFVCDE